MHNPSGGRIGLGLRIVAGLSILALFGCSGGGGPPTGSDLPKDDTIWIRVSTDGVAPIITVHTSREDAESRTRGAGVAASPISDADPMLYFFRNVEPFEPDVTDWTIRLEANPSASGICLQSVPDVASPELTLCSTLEPISAP